MCIRDSFTSVSQEIASLLFDFMLENVGVPSADLLVVDFIGDGEPYLGVLKLNYKHSYIHYVDHEDGRLNDILRQPCSLPTEGPVSYTHLDVYKRQAQRRSSNVFR